MGLTGVRPGRAKPLSRTYVAFNDDHLSFPTAWLFSGDDEYAISSSGYGETSHPYALSGGGDGGETRKPYHFVTCAKNRNLKIFDRILFLDVIFRR